MAEMYGIATVTFTIPYQMTDQDYDPANTTFAGRAAVDTGFVNQAPVEWISRQMAQDPGSEASWTTVITQAGSPS